MAKSKQNFQPNSTAVLNATKTGFYLAPLSPPTGMSSMGNTTLAKNLEATITELGFTDSLSWSTQSINPPDTNVAHYPRLMYYYHPDYLGHVEYITDLDGLPYQHFYYTVWGETLLDQKATRPGMNFDSPYRFNGKELDDETGLYYYGARYYTCPERHCRFGNPKVSVWLGVDPMASERSWLTPYNFVSNNPITRIDPDGMLDWQPGVDESGSAVYTAEAGDNANTLATQYGLTQAQAEQITGTTGSTPIAEGTQIEGCKAFEATGSEVLKLDLNSKLATEQRIIDQAVFAMDYSKKKGDWGFNSTDFFNNTRFKDVIKASGTLTIDEESIPLELQIPVYRPGTSDGSSKSTFLGNAPFTIKQTTGNRFKQTDILLFGLYHPDTKGYMGDYRILAPRNKSGKLFERLNK